MALSTNPGHPSLKKGGEMYVRINLLITVVFVVNILLKLTAMLSPRERGFKRVRPDTK